MARQPKRSAFVLTSKFQSFIRVYFHIFLLISWTIIIVNCENDVPSSIRIDNYNNNDNISIITAIINNHNINSNSSFSVNNNNNNGGAIVGIGGQQPKFGDRLSPRHRQFNGPNNNSNQTITTIFGGNNNSVANSSTKFLDSFYNLSNFNNNNNNNNNYNAQISAHNPFYTSNSNSFSSNIVQSSSSLDNDHINYYHHDKDDQYQRLNNDQLLNSNSDSVNHSNNNNNNNNHNDVDNDTIINSSNNNNNNRSSTKSNSIKSILNNGQSGHSDHSSSSSTSGISNINNNSRRQTSDNNLWWISGNDRKNSLRNNHDKIENEEDNIEIDAVVHNVALPVAEEQQRLRRRNDYDIDRNDLIDNQHHNQHHLTNMNVSKADRLIEMSTEFFIIPSSTTSNPPQDSVYQQNQQHHQQQQHQQITPRPILILAPRTPSSTSNLSVTPPSIISTVHLEGLRKEPWVVPVLVLSSLSMIMMAAFEIFVLFKAWRTSPSRRHLFLGQMLLLGLFSCAGLGAVLTANPSVLSCATIRFGVGVAYALVFAALLVKCVFLISLNGGVYLPAPYQGLLLLFAVLIQVAIGTQWLMTQPPDIQTLTVPISSSHLNGGSVIGSNSGSSSGKFSMLITSSDITRIHGTTVISLCKTQFSEFLLSLVYIVFLIIFVTVLAIKSRGIRDNYREATYIGLAIGGAIPIWLGWTLCGLAVTDRHKDACIAFGLVATSATVFLVMFMPKGRQLAAMGKEGLYVEDREEQFSSLSRAGSGYSPSFFHFKPIKYGVMGHMPNSTANTGLGGNGGTINTPGNPVIGNNTKHQSGATLGGDRVALVAAGPPSYTRMYHYFPAHLTHPFCFYPTPPPPPPPLSTPLSPLKAIGSHTPTSAHIAQTIRYPGLFMRPDEANVYTTLEPTLSSNPNVYFQRSGGVHPGMMY